MPMPYALCPMPYAPCPMPARAPHVTEKGYISSLTHQAQLVLAQCSDTVNPAQQRRQAQSQQSAATQSVLGLTHGAGETGFDGQKYFVRVSHTGVKNPVSFVRVRPGLSKIVLIRVKISLRNFLSWKTNDECKF